VSDSHIRILRLMAHQTQRDLDDHDALDHAGDTASPGRRHDLVRTATRTRGRVAAAQARRRYHEPVLDGSVLIGSGYKPAR
jgi:hypothetical protein